MTELPKTARASVMLAYDTDPVVQEVPIPELTPRAVLVKVEAATMCGSDVHVGHGLLADPKGVFTSKLPMILGHEIVGRVVRLGSERSVDALNRPLQQGDLIAFTYARCQSCYWCTVAGQPMLCSNSSMNYGYGPADRFPYLTGGYAEYVYVMPDCKIVKVPEGLDPAVAAASTCAFRTVVHAFERVGRLETTDTVVIQGTGPVGLFAVAHAVQSGAKQVIVIGNPTDRLAVATRWGASEAMDFTEVDARARRQRILDATDGRGADVVIECSGAPGALDESLTLVRRGGTVTVVGVGAKEPARVSATDLVTREISLLGSASGDIAHYYRALEFLKDFGHKFSWADIIGNRYGLEAVPAALNAMRTQAEIKPVIVPSL